MHFGAADISCLDSVHSKLTDPFVRIAVDTGHAKWYEPYVQQGPGRTIPPPIYIVVQRLAY